MFYEKRHKNGPRCSATCHRDFTEGRLPTPLGFIYPRKSYFFRPHRSHHHTAVGSQRQAPQRHKKPVATTEETCKVAPEARLQRMPRRPPSGNSFHDREAGTRLYIHMCLDKKVTLFRLQGNPGQRAGIQTGHLTVLC